MTTKEIVEYYNDTEHRAIRADLSYALTMLKGGNVAIDCGCGAGADIEYLRDNNITVFAFDLEAESITRCRERFKHDDKVVLSQDSFLSYAYPKASLVVADASLFFCPPKDFDAVWQKLVGSLSQGGVFCGSFLGPNDSMASADYNRDQFWPDVLVFSEEELRLMFKQFEILKFTEHNVLGNRPNGEPNQWHIFAVVLRKL